MRKSLKEYSQFVDAVTSTESKDLETFFERCRELEEQGINVPRFLTGALGGSSEGGEYNEIVKKLIFHRKPLTDEVRFHLKREQGDKLWYWIQDCLALELDPYEVIEENIRKLQSRYPGGKFDAWYSENRKEGDL